MRVADRRKWHQWEGRVQTRGKIRGRGGAREQEGRLEERGVIKTGGTRVDAALVTRRGKNPPGTCSQCPKGEESRRRRGRKKSRLLGPWSA